MAVAFSSGESGLRIDNTMTMRSLRIERPFYTVVLAHLSASTNELNVGVANAIGLEVVLMTLS